MKLHVIRWYTIFTKRESKIAMRLFPANDNLKNKHKITGKIKFYIKAVFNFIELKCAVHIWIKKNSHCLFPTKKNVAATAIIYVTHKM